MPGCALASLARSSGGAKVLVSWSRADRPFLSGLAHCSLLSGPSGSDAFPLIITYPAGCRLQRLADREDLADRGLVAQPGPAGS